MSAEQSEIWRKGQGVGWNGRWLHIATINEIFFTMESGKKWKYVWNLRLGRKGHFGCHLILSSSSCRAIGTDIPYPFSPPIPIVHRFQQILIATLRILTELLYVGSNGHAAFARPCEGVHRSTSLMSSFILLQQCPACLVRLIKIVFVMGGIWPYSCCFVGCSLQDLFNIARSILV